MASGGARNRSGPGVDPGSFRSDARGLSFDTLPAEGFSGLVPEFPLPDASVRELDVWAELWSTPQAAAWALESWRHRSVAMFARVSVRSEDVGAPSSLLAQVHRFADQIGLTPAGLKENSWTIARDELASRRDSAPVAKVAVSAKERLRALSNGG
jgi:hypothetical protein